MKHMRQCLVLSVLAAVSLSGGCAWLYGARQADDFVSQPQRMDATRAELLVGFEKRTVQLQTLSAIVEMYANNEAMVVPATLADNIRYRAGKDYRKKFERAQVNVSLLMRRMEGGARNLSVSGVIVGPNANVRMLAKNDAFWISLPNIHQDESTDAKGVIYVGESQRLAPRRADLFSIRPQDVWDLMFTDEVMMPDMVSYMETWPDFYVINFLNPGSPERIFSKIWISRVDLTMAVHQIFDGAGRIIAEARFQAYESVENAAKRVRLLMPTEIMMLWPRDRLVLEMKLQSIKVDEPILDKWFEPVEPRQYKVQKIDDIPVSSPPAAGTKAQ